LSQGKKHDDLEPYFEPLDSLDAKLKAKIRLVLSDSPDDAPEARESEVSQSEDEDEDEDDQEFQVSETSSLADFSGWK